MKKVLFFDIDGTLLNSELKIPEGVKRELKRLKEAGHYLFVASGRPLAFISNQIIDAGFNGFVLCNGAHVELNNETIYENRIPYEKVNDLMNLLESVDCEYDFETATDCYIDSAYHDFIEFFKVCDIRHEKLITDYDKEEVMHRTLKIEISAKKIMIRSLIILRINSILIIMVLPILLKFVPLILQRQKACKKY